MMMKYCTYALAAVSGVLGLIVIMQCLRYETCSSKHKKGKTVRENEEQSKPLATKRTEEEVN